RQFAAWIVAELATTGDGPLQSARRSLLIFAASLCGMLLVASVVAAWMFGRRMRELGAALARVGDGHSDIHLDDDAHDEMGDMARAANRTARTLRETMDLRRSMRLAEQVQRALLPAKPPTLPGLQIAHFCDYCDEVGGDYIDYIPVGDDQQPDGWAVVVGDGTGHGVGAALLMATARSVLRSQPLRFGELAKGVGVINQHICEQVPDGKFVTLFMLVFSADAKRLCWLSAGHDEAILFDPLSGEFSELRGSDLPLGVEASWEFTHHSRQSPLARGTVIVIGTDGIWEMRNASDQMFGKDRLKRIMRRAASEAGPEIGRQILEALHQHRGDLPPQDDVTFVVIKVDG
ncbi:MAG: SpoIIE family protein phosphatase, partial [Phycisphaerales bacterium]|nr:SpoIIE family protein phosphatase [Phycisphaerales bacterium]